MGDLPAFSGICAFWAQLGEARNRPTGAALILRGVRAGSGGVAGPLFDSAAPLLRGGPGGGQRFPTRAE